MTIRFLARQIAVCLTASAACLAAFVASGEKVFAQTTSTTGAFVADAVVPINDRTYPDAALLLIQTAQKSLRICLYQTRYYRDFPGSYSNQLVDALILARRRGVDISVIVDSSPWRMQGGHDEENLNVAARLAREGCHAYLDSPLIQSHQKISVVDDRITVVASSNWSHFSLSVNREVGVAVWSADVAKYFTNYFEARIKEGEPFAMPANATPYPTPELQITPLPPGTVKGGISEDRKPLTAEEFASSLKVPLARQVPLESLSNRDYYPRLHEAISKAARSVDLVQDYALYYFEPPKADTTPVPGSRPAGVPSLTNMLFEDLAAARRRGLPVRAVLNFGVGQDGAARFSGRDFAMRLSALGVDARRDDPLENLHAKMLLIDDEVIVVGSTNWSYQAVELNNECSLLLRSKELGAHYRKWVDSVVSRSTPVTEPEPRFTPAPSPTAGAANKAETE